MSGALRIPSRTSSVTTSAPLALSSVEPLASHTNLATSVREVSAVGREREVGGEGGVQESCVFVVLSYLSVVIVVVITVVYLSVLLSA